MHSVTGACTWSVTASHVHPVTTTQFTKSVLRGSYVALTGRAFTCDHISITNADIISLILSVKSQKGAINVQRCFVESQKGAIAVQGLWR